ncbi:MAG TPA: SAM-dependent methyltransferase [Casimicrobiaceae bacterium]|nr:SAM-dependent methyltransferase [Casimicrobiaceae bacterium]
MKGRLFVIPSTLGLVPPDAVLPRRTLDVARGLTHFVAETPKTTRRFFKEIDGGSPLRSVDIAELSEHTPRERVAQLLQPALSGADLGLISDAGCPGIADPGALLVAAAHRAGIEVVPLPGSSAIMLALMASGLNGQAFAFHGYLPVKPGARANAIKTLDDTLTRSGATQIFIETPYRNDAIVKAVVATCRGSTQFCVAVDLTLASEQVISRTIAAWRDATRPALAKRPAVFLLGRP